MFTVHRERKCDKTVCEQMKTRLKQHSKDHQPNCHRPLTRILTSDTKAWWPLLETASAYHVHLAIQQCSAGGLVILNLLAVEHGCAFTTATRSTESLIKRKEWASATAVTESALWMSTICSLMTPGFSHAYEQVSTNNGHLQYLVSESNHALL